VSDRRPAPEIGKGDELLHERASATPFAPSPAPARTPPRAAGKRAVGKRAVTKRAVTKRPGVAATRASLRAVQEWFAQVIMHPDTPAAGVASARKGAALGVTRAKDLGRVVTAGPRLSAMQRMAVYHHAYRARLVDVLADDYPSVAHAIGEREFESLCRAYIERHPSKDPNLNHFGRHMPAFCRTRRTAPWRRFAADLAALEWAMVDSIHAPDASVLSLEALATVAPEQWASALLPKSDSLQVLRFDYPVNAYLQAVREEKAPPIPAPEESATAVYRHGKRIWRMDLTPAMAGLLEDLFAGKTLGEALASIEAHADGPETLAEAERNVMVWFRAWVAGGFFARVEFHQGQGARS
jgi:hypothetical protein